MSEATKPKPKRAARKRKTELPIPAAASNGLVPAGSKPQLHVKPAEEGENFGHAISRMSVTPIPRHAFNISLFSAGMLPGDIRPDAPEMSSVLEARVAEMAGGDLKLVGEVLASQALSLDTMFTELARRSALNMGEHLDASERFMRLALKAQSNSRAALEALAKLHTPREQIIKHIQVREGGQAVITDQYHNHRGGAENAQLEQPHVQRTRGSALPSPDALANGVPITSDAREEAVSITRRKVARGTEE